ncbi:uncharacterized protein LOC107268085 [Cephus cinctus]|uniref:Uncharacterized protein LOC107268085 n=1 Tax=Cephus cinctus TaxID=211228 RepID=A0AAJ7BWH1_CEPCN|nr:uncharacterized protein LOC107268085 [Cephus cinctus]
MKSLALNNAKRYPESNAAIKSEGLAMLTYHLFEDNYLLEEIDRIIRERWKTIGRTTRYGWLAAYSHRKTIAQDEAKVLTGLANKIGLENCGEAIDSIRKISKYLHPNDIPSTSMIILNETYMALMLRKRRGSKSSNKAMKDQFPTVFTISDNCCLPSSSIR